MRNIDKYLSLLNDEVDGLLLTSPYSRYYGAEFEISEGVAVVSKKGCRYFTDSRYIESAEAGIRYFEVLPINQFTGFIQRINDAIADFGITTLHQGLGLGMADGKPYRVEDQVLRQLHELRL